MSSKRKAAEKKLADAKPKKRKTQSQSGKKKITLKYIAKEVGKAEYDRAVELQRKSSRLFWNDMFKTMSERIKIDEEADALYRASTVLKLKALREAEWSGEIKCEQLVSKRASALVTARYQYSAVDDIKPSERGTRTDKIFQILSLVPLRPCMFKEEPSPRGRSTKVEMPAVYEFLHLHRWKDDFGTTKFIFLYTAQEVNTTNMRREWSCFVEQKEFYELTTIIQTIDKWIQDTKPWQSWQQSLTPLLSDYLLKDLTPIVLGYAADGLASQASWNQLVLDAIH